MNRNENFPWGPDDGQDYMNPRQLAWFRDRLLEMRSEIMETSGRTIHDLRQGSQHCPDPVDWASSESLRTVTLREQERWGNLLVKIDQALGRIADGSYGYCSETGEPIGLGRLMARPVATLCIEAQRRREPDRHGQTRAPMLAEGGSRALHG